MNDPIEETIRLGKLWQTETEDGRQFAAQLKRSGFPDRDDGATRLHGMIEISCPGCGSREIDYAMGACPCCRHEIMSCYCRVCGHGFLTALGYAPVSLTESESLGGDEVSL